MTHLPEGARRIFEIARAAMRELMGGREVMSVFHLPDGEGGFSIV